MENCLKDAKLRLGKLIIAETRAVLSLFKDHVYPININSTKSTIFGAAGLLRQFLVCYQ